MEGGPQGSPRFSEFWTHFRHEDCKPFVKETVLNCIVAEGFNLGRGRLRAYQN
jgi:hypothetical protein